MGHAFLRAIHRAAGPFGRGFDGLADDGSPFDIVLLAVPDAAISSAVQAVVRGPLVGHCSGASTLDVLGDREAFSLHPLMTVTEAAVSFDGASAAIAGTSARALSEAHDLAAELGLRPVTIADEDRAAYHAAASVAANFLVTLEDAAETLIRSAGGDRAMLLPLVRAAVDNWERVGGPDALTGPIARGDEETVARQRAAVAERAPELLDLFDVATAATRALARRR